MPLDILTIAKPWSKSCALISTSRSISPVFHRPFPSGAPFIFAVQAARLGLKTAAIGSVGADAFGDCLLQQLRADGVSTAGLRQLPDQPTGVAFVSYQADGSRSFVFRLGAGGHIKADMLLPELFEGPRCFHIMGSTLSMSAEVLEVCRLALQMALDAGALISFDPNLRPELLPPHKARVAFADFVSAADILLPTEAELLQLCETDTVEQAVSDLRAQQPERLIVVTRGAAGCTVYSADGAVDAPGYPAAEIDPTGAGDCFDAGFLSELLSGESALDAARLANACGALTVSAKGPMSGAKTRAEVARFMRGSTA